MNLDQQYKLDAYLSGRMTPDELQSFQAELGSNPELQQQVAFQSDVMKGISEYRKVQLKARLDAVDVTPTLWASIQQSTVGQFVAGAVVVSIISASLFMYLSSDKTDKTPEVETEVVMVSPLPTTEDTLIVQPEYVQETADRNTTSQNNPNKIPQVEKTDETKKTNKPFNPKVAVPKAGDVTGDEDFTPDDLPSPVAAATANKPNAPIEVEVISGRNTKIKYRYFGGKLYLYGDFSDQPYEILEINAPTSRRIYLYHLKAYYEITPSDKPVNVVEVTDQKLIQELTILRKVK